MPEETTNPSAPPPRPATVEEAAALDRILSAIEDLSHATEKLGMPVAEAVALAPAAFEGLADTPHLDAVLPGRPAVSPERKQRLRELIAAAKTDRERVAEVLALVAQIAAGVARGAA